MLSSSRGELEFGVSDVEWRFRKLVRRVQIKSKTIWIVCEKFESIDNEIPLDQQKAPEAESDSKPNLREKETQKNLTFAPL